MLIVTQLKPNPDGKDRSPGHIPQSKLHGEWVDIKNTGPSAANLGGIALNHKAYSHDGSWKWAFVMSLTGTLQPGEVMRVHSGNTVPVASLPAQDRAGAHYHAFTGNSVFVWNNVQGDTAGLWKPTGKLWIDKATYSPSPPEGVILVRKGDMLVPSTSSISSW